MGGCISLSSVAPLTPGRAGLRLCVHERCDSRGCSASHSASAPSECSHAHAHGHGHRHGHTQSQTGRRLVHTRSGRVMAIACCGGGGASAFAAALPTAVALAAVLRRCVALMTSETAPLAPYQWQFQCYLQQLQDELMCGRSVFASEACRVQLTEQLLEAELLLRQMDSRPRWMAPLRAAHDEMEMREQRAACQRIKSATRRQMMMDELAEPPHASTVTFQTPPAHEADEHAADSQSTSDEAKLDEAEIAIAKMHPQDLVEEVSEEMVRFTAGTRASFLAATDRWLGSGTSPQCDSHSEVGEPIAEETSRILWIVGAAGVGKSCLAARIYADNWPDIVAVHRCRYDSARTADARLFVHSIAAQLAQRIGPYRAKLCSIVAAQPECLALEAGRGDKAKRPSAAEMWRQLVLLPLEAVAAEVASSRREVGRRYAIMVDALDESACPGPGCLGAAATKADGDSDTIAALLASSLHALPDWLGFIVTSRPDFSMADGLGDHARLELKSTTAENLSDVRALLTQCVTAAHAVPLASAASLAGFESLAGDAITELVNVLLSKCKGVFLCARLLLHRHGLFSHCYAAAPEADCAYSSSLHVDPFAPDHSAAAACSEGISSPSRNFIVDPLTRGEVLTWACREAVELDCLDGARSAAWDRQVRLARSAAAAATSAGSDRHGRSNSHDHEHGHAHTHAHGQTHAAAAEADAQRSAAEAEVEAELSLLLRAVACILVAYEPLTLRCVAELCGLKSHKEAVALLRPVGCLFSVSPPLAPARWQHTQGAASPGRKSSRAHSTSGPVQALSTVRASHRCVRDWFVSSARLHDVDVIDPGGGAAAAGNGNGSDCEVESIEEAQGRYHIDVAEAHLYIAEFCWRRLLDPHSTLSVCDAVGGGAAAFSPDNSPVIRPTFLEIPGLTLPQPALPRLRVDELVAQAAVTSASGSGGSRSGLAPAPVLSFSSLCCMVECGLLHALDSGSAAAAASFLCHPQYLHMCALLGLTGRLAAGFDAAIRLAKQPHQPHQHHKEVTQQFSFRSTTLGGRNVSSASASCSPSTSAVSRVGASSWCWAGRFNLQEALGSFQRFVARHSAQWAQSADSVYLDAAGSTEPLVVHLASPLLPWLASWTQRSSTPSSMR